MPDRHFSGFRNPSPKVSSLISGKQARLPIAVGCPRRQTTQKLSHCAWRRFPRRPCSEAVAFSYRPNLRDQTTHAHRQAHWFRSGEHSRPTAGLLSSIIAGTALQRKRALELDLLTIVGDLSWGFQLSLSSGLMPFRVSSACDHTLFCCRRVKVFWKWDRYLWVKRGFSGD